MIFCRFSRQAFNHRKRCHGIFLNQTRGKAVQNYSRPTMEEYMAPRESWTKLNAKRQSRYSYSLGSGVGFFVFTIGYAWYNDLIEFNSGPEGLYIDNKLLLKANGNVVDINFKSPAEPSTVSENVEPSDSKSEKNYTKVPKDFPEEVTFLLIGGGTASFSAMRSIRAADPRAKVMIISEEATTPYMRPPLTKELWYAEKSKSPTGQLMFKTMSGRERSVFFEKESFYTHPNELDEGSKGGISVVRGHKVINLDPNVQEVTLDDGKKIRYEKCLIATGGRPRSLECLNGLESKVSTFRTLKDYEKLDEFTNQKGIKSLAVIGGGFLGTELAMSLALKGTEKGYSVSQIFPEQGLLSKILPEFLSNWAITVMRKSGVNVIPGASIKSAKLNGDKIILDITGNEEKTVEADHVVLAVGIDPNIELAKSAGLEIDSQNGGIVADESLATNFKNIYVAGDVASYIDDRLGRQRIEHHDNAIVTGKLAGDNMAGGNKVMSNQPMFWSDIGQEIGIEGVGQVDSSLETVSVFAKDKVEDEYERGIVFYKNSEDVLVGILLWNVFNQMSTARRLIREHKKYDDLSEVAKLLKLYKVPEAENDEQAEQAASDAS